MSQEIFDAARALVKERGLDQTEVNDLIETALLAAYKKAPGAAPYARIEVDHSTDEFRVFALDLDEDQEDDLVDVTPRHVNTATGEVVDRTLKLNQERLAEYLAEGNEIPEQEVEVPEFGYVSALAAKQVLIQGLRKLESEKIVAEFANQVGTLVRGVVQQSDGRLTIVRIRDGVEAILPRKEQVEKDRYIPGTRMAFILVEAEVGAGGHSLVVSRQDPELVAQLFEEEIPELQQGLIEITHVAREAGSRAKIAVRANADNIDPVGACIGPRGARIRNIVSELRGEKIDIVPIDAEPARFLAKALSPANIREMFVDDEAQEATIVLPDDQVGIAIGRGGENIRLATHLTGWHIDLISETDFAGQGGSESDDDQVETEASEMICHAIMANGKRCKNDAISGTRYCGLEQHQALANIDSDSVLALLDEDQGQADVASPNMLADGLGDEERELIKSGMPVEADINHVD